MSMPQDNCLGRAQGEVMHKESIARVTRERNVDITLAPRGTDILLKAFN
jgi:hypothetical protein